MLDLITAIDVDSVESTKHESPIYLAAKRFLKKDDWFLDILEGEHKYIAAGKEEGNEEPVLIPILQNLKPLKEGDELLKFDGDLG